MSMKNNQIKSILSGLLVVVIFSALGYFFLFTFFSGGIELISFFEDRGGIYSLYSRSCKKPLTYRIGTIDPKFNLSEQRLHEIIEEASSVWSNLIDKQLFAYDPEGEIEINLIYDYRQSSVDQLNKLGIKITATEENFNRIKENYDQLHAQYTRQHDELEKLQKKYNQEVESYNQEVEKVKNNKRPSSNSITTLGQRRIYLENSSKQISQKADDLNDLVNIINAQAATLNKLIGELNLNAGTYNGIGSQLGESFEKGVYIQGPEGRFINIYEFQTEKQLIRLFAHELGHALGMDHTTGADDIMYYLNQYDTLEPTSNDLAELKSVCN